MDFGSYCGHSSATAVLPQIKALVNLCVWAMMTTLVSWGRENDV